MELRWLVHSSLWSNLWRVSPLECGALYLFWQSTGQNPTALPSLLIAPQWISTADCMGRWQRESVHEAAVIISTAEPLSSPSPRSMPIYTKKKQIADGLKQYAISMDTQLSEHKKQGGWQCSTLAERLIVQHAGCLTTLLLNRDRPTRYN